MTSLEIIVDDREVAALLKNLADLGADTSKPMRTVSLLMDQEVRNTFRDQADPWGSPWPPHAPLTTERREARGNTSTQKLIDSGAMYASLEHTSDANSATVTMDGPAEIHQYGAGRIPPRPMFPDDDEHDGPPPNWWDAVTAPIFDAFDAAVEK